MRKLLLTLSFIIFQIPLFGQNIQRLNMMVNYGVIIPHSTELRPFAQSNISGFGVHYQFLKPEKKNWEICNCYHYLGLQLSWHNFGNPDVLGSALSLSATFEPILWKKGKTRLSLLSGIGTSYLNRVFDPNDNPDNVFFSSRLSFLGFVAPRLEYRFSEKWALESSLTFNHISNGGLQQPNKGMNYLILGLGINHYLNYTEFPEFEKEEFSKEWAFYLELAGHTSYSETAMRRKPSFSVFSEALRPINRIQGIGAGVEMVLDFSLPVEASRAEAFMPAPFVAHHFLFGKVDFCQVMALYTLKPVGYNDYTFYQRYILRYQILSSLHLGVSLKAHGHVAESIDVRLGWKF